MAASDNFDRPELAGEPVQASPRWRVDRTIPLAVLIFLAIQTVVSGMWIGRTETRLGTIEDWVKLNNSTDRRLSVIESQLARIEHHLRIGE
jgi:hypothetical protein